VQQDSNSDASSVSQSISKEAGHLIVRERERERERESIWIRAVGVCLHNEGSLICVAGPLGNRV